MDLHLHHPLDDRLPEMLRSGRSLRGVFNALPSPAIVEMCGYAGFDFVIIDNEHGSAGFETTENMLRAARASGIVPVVRCLRHDISRVLDMGASAVQIPMVGSAEEARDLAQQVRYPREGRRGSAFSPRAAGYGAFPGIPHTRRSNEGIALIVMIETAEAVAQAGEIAAVEGVDAVFVGPNDLSHSMGFDNDWKCPEVEAEIERALRAVSGAGKCAGIIAPTLADEVKFAAWGARYFANVTTSLFTRALQEASAAGGRGKAAAGIAY
jgi:4-hydroxy-2-oxoheptanedioate aldolase